MPIIKNKAPGPRVFNLKPTQGGVTPQRTLQPGEAADLDLAVPIDEDPITLAWKKAGEIELADADAMKPAILDMEAVLKAEAEANAAVEKARVLRERLRAAEVDAERRTPPRQQAADGGPLQSPTVDGRGGDLTPAQVEDGRPELPPAEAAETVARRQAEAPKGEPKPATRART